MTAPDRDAACEHAACAGPELAAPEPAAPAASELTELERAILDFEGTWREHVGAKEEAIRARLGIGPARYYQLLGRLIDTGAALAHDPLLVKRLRRMRDRRDAARVARERALAR